MKPRLRTFPAASMGDLRELTVFVLDACAAAGASEEAAGDVRLAVEEAFTNILTHGYAGRPGPLTLGVTVAGGRMALTIEDEAKPFDPAAVAAVDVASEWSERDVGGLGWHLIRSVMDEVHHEAAERGGNRLTLVKRIAAGGPSGADDAGTGESGP